jgi:hypothetical protein
MIAMARPAEQPSAIDKIDPLLWAGVERDPKNEHGVIVVFSKLPGRRVLDRLKLRAVPPFEAIGHLLRGQILEIAKRPDVRSVRGRPEYTLL